MAVTSDGLDGVGATGKKARLLRVGVAALAPLLLWPRAAVAQPSGEANPPAAQPARTTKDALEAIEERLRALERENARMRAELEELTEDHRFAQERMQAILPLSGKFTGYVDLGFFFVQGNGTALQNDLGHKNIPKYADVPDSWVFLGDPLATAINARGEPPETWESRAVTFDAIDNDGTSSFLLNAVNFAIFAGIGEHLTLNASMDFVPRGRDVSNPDGASLGDFIDLKLAYAEYIVPIEAFKLSLYAGKFDSVLGYEYRIQESPDRVGVTPSLICRYTCGRPLGLKARAIFLDEALAIAIAVTNGSHGTEGFPTYGEIDQNQFKTIAGRLSSKVPLGTGLELGVSGAFGAQDLQEEDSVHQWHAGIDVHLDWNDFDVSFELTRGRMVGKSLPGQTPCTPAPCLDYKGGYGQVGYRLFNWLMPYARADFRDAVHRSGQSFVYVSDLARFTGGARVELGTHAIVKAEYTHIAELGPIPSIPDDVFTSSLIVKY